MNHRVREYLVTAGLLVTAGTIVPFTDVPGPDVAAAVGTGFLGIGHYIAQWHRHKFWAVNWTEGDKVVIGVRRRWFTGNWPKEAHKIDPSSAPSNHRYNTSDSSIEDTLKVATINPKDEDASEQMVEAVVRAKRLASEFAGDRDDTAQLKRSADKLIKQSANKRISQKKLDKAVQALLTPPR